MYIIPKKKKGQEDKAYFQWNIYIYNYVHLKRTHYSVLIYCIYTYLYFVKTTFTLSLMHNSADLFQFIIIIIFYYFSTNIISIE